MLNQEEHKGWNSAKQHKNSTTTPGEYNTSHVYTALPEAVISEAAHKLRNFEGGYFIEPQNLERIRPYGQTLPREGLPASRDPCLKNHG